MDTVTRRNAARPSATLNPTFAPMSLSKLAEAHLRRRHGHVGRVVLDADGRFVDARAARGRASMSPR